MVRNNKSGYKLTDRMIIGKINPNLSNSATFWKRTLAFIFDLLLINLVVAWPFQSTLQQYALKEFSIDTILPAEIYFIVLMIFLLALLYFTFLEYYIGQTPGQMLMNMESISLDGNMTFWKALVRNVFILPFFPFYILWALDPIHLIFYKQRLLERWTGTNTVMKGIHGKSDYEQFNLKKVE
jgi:uncharacterized RDD family membrane protein YckC